MTKAVSGSPIAVAAQYLGDGMGGIAEVARMTIAALSPQFPVRALSCMEHTRLRLVDTHVQGFGGNRVKFIVGLARELPRVDRIIYDFAGTARASGPTRLFGKPNAVWAHGVEIWGTPRNDYRRALHRADLVLVNSKFTLEHGQATLSGAKDVRVCALATIHDHLPDSEPASDGPPTALLLGRIDKQLAKGHDLLISIWPRVIEAVPEARLVFAGGGGGVADVRALAAASSARDSIDVLGFVEPQNIATVWRNATVFVMPARGEGFGIVYVEAMRQGVPIIASTQDAGHEVNRHGQTGFNVSRDRPDDLTDAVITLLRDQDMSRRFGDAGQKLWRSDYSFSGFRRRLAEATADFMAL